MENRHKSKLIIHDDTITFNVLTAFTVPTAFTVLTMLTAFTAAKRIFHHGLAEALTAAHAICE